MKYDTDWWLTRISLHVWIWSKYRDHREKPSYVQIRLINPWIWVLKYLTFTLFCATMLSRTLTGESRRLHNMELYALYSSPDIIRLIKSRILSWAGYVAHLGERRGAYMVLVRKLEGRRSLERPWRRWEDNIKIDLREVGWGHGLDRSGSGWRAFVNDVMKSLVPKMRWMSWVAQDMLTSQEGLCSMESVFIKDIRILGFDVVLPGFSFLVCWRNVITAFIFKGWRFGLTELARP